MSVQCRTGYISSFHCSMSPCGSFPEQRRKWTCPLPATECCFSRSPTEQSVKILKENATLGSIHRSLVTFSWDAYSFSSQGKDSLDNQLTHFFSTLPSQLLFGGWKDNKNNFTEKTKDYSLIMFPSHSSFLPILSFANFFLNIKKQKEEKAAENGNRWGLKSNVLAWSQQGVFSHLVIGNLRSTCLRPVSNSSRWISPFRMEDAPN